MYQFQREWTPREGYIPGICIQQPYAQALAEGAKGMELRTWGTHYRGLIAIIASLSWIGGCRPSKSNRVSQDQYELMQEATRRLGLSSRRIIDYPTGAIVAIGILSKCAPFSSLERYRELSPLHKSNAAFSPRFVGWQIEDVERLPEPIPIKGTLGLIPVERSPAINVAIQRVLRRNRTETS